VAKHAVHKSLRRLVRIEPYEPVPQLVHHLFDANSVTPKSFPEGVLVVIPSFRSSPHALGGNFMLDVQIYESQF
jgi:hypothetical protein